MRIERLLLAGLAVLCLAGCAIERIGPGTRTAPGATTVVPAAAKTATAEYWWARPATASARSTNFDKLWDACRQEAIDRFFWIERSDYRAGVMTTRPMVSAQLFELWRRDVGDSEQLRESTLATVRRTIRFEFTRSADGSYGVVPKVLIERYAQRERRITSTAQMSMVFVPQVDARPVEADGEMPSRTSYWYAAGRDLALEKQLADSLQKRL